MADELVAPHPKRGPKPGSHHKVTKDAAKLMGELVDYGLSHAEKWLSRTARKNPARALDALAKLAEYRMPKLAKVDNSGTVGVQIMERRFYGGAGEVIDVKTKRALELGDAVFTDEDGEIK